MAAEKKSINYIFDFNYKLFNSSGFGLLENPKKWEKNLYSIYHVAIHFTYAFIIALFFVDLYYVTNDTEKLSLNLCVTLITFGSLLKIWALMIKLKKLTLIRKNFKEDFNLSSITRDERYWEIKEKTADLMARMTKFLYVIAMTSATMWVVYPLVDPTLKERKFPVPFVLVTDMSTPTFELVYVFISLMLYHFVQNICSNDLLFFGHMMRIRDQFDILLYNISKIKDLYLRVKFEKFIDGYEDYSGNGESAEEEKRVESDIYEKLKMDPEWRERETKRLMRQNIVHHKMILKQLKLIQHTYNFQLFIQITIGAMVISVIAFDVILKSRKFNAPVVQQGLYVIGVTFDIFVMCYFGTEVEKKNEELLYALYDTPWYEMDKSNSKIVLFMAQKCKKRLKLNAKYVFSLNLSTFLSLMKTSYNVMALLNETR